MSAHALLNLLNKSRIRDKMQGLSCLFQAGPNLTSAQIANRDVLMFEKVC